MNTLYNVDVSVFRVVRCLEYFQESGNGNGLKLYYKKHSSSNKYGYKLIGNDI